MAHKVYKGSASGGVRMDPKDPDDTIALIFDFAGNTNNRTQEDTLDTANSEQISSYVLAFQSGLTNAGGDAIILNGTAVKVHAAGGTAGSEYTVTCKATTNSATPRILSATMIIPVAER